MLKILKNLNKLNERYIRTMARNKGFFVIQKDISCILCLRNLKLVVVVISHLEIFKPKSALQ